ncbi:MAG: glycosyltransferase [Bifidobacteriaceae bacterium]|jgi:D-inositol-3-phosphate glycosyltransferase|nr:glycosyltransferase [Bifidobacteriaceae bacterium]
MTLVAPVPCPCRGGHRREGGAAPRTAVRTADAARRAGTVRRVALISFHTSPTAVPGEGDAGGMNVYVASVAAALARHGVAVDVYTRDDGAGPAAEPIAPGVVVRRVQAGPRRAVPKARLAALAGQFAAELAKAERPDVVHSHYWLSGLAALGVTRQWGVPHVLSLHTVASLKISHLAPGDAPEPQERLEAERRLVAGSDLVVAATEAERLAILADGRGRTVEPVAERVIVLPPGVDTQRFRPGPGPEDGDLPARAGRPQGYVLQVGRVQPLKGQDLAILALAKLPAAARPVLVLTGEPAPDHKDYGAYLRRLVARLGLGPDVVFLGARRPDQLVRLYRGARAVLMPSRSETYGLVASEAAACGTPVIASATTGLRYSVEDGVTGLLVEGRDPGLWAGALARVIGSPELARRLGRAGVERARRLTWDHTAERLLDAYQALVRPAA